MANFDTHTYANRGRKDNERGWNEQWMPFCYFQRAFNLIHFAMQVPAVVAVVQYCFFYSFSCVIEALLNQCTTNCTLFKPDIYNATLFHVDSISIIYPNCRFFLSTICCYTPTKLLNSLPIWLCWNGCVDTFFYGLYCGISVKLFTILLYFILKYFCGFLMENSSFCFKKWIGTVDLCAWNRSTPFEWPKPTYSKYTKRIEKVCTQPAQCINDYT